MKRCFTLAFLLLVVGGGGFACAGDGEVGEASGGVAREEAQLAQAGRDACSLVTREELEAIRGRPLREGELNGDTCGYYAAGGIGMQFVELTARWYDGRMELDAARAGAQMVDSHMRSETGESAVSMDSPEGLGDEAFFIGAGMMDMLFVRKGDAFIRVEAMGPREEMIAIARLAVGRL